MGEQEAQVQPDLHYSKPHSGSCLHPPFPQFLSAARIWNRRRCRPEQKPAISVCASWERAAATNVELVARAFAAHAEQAGAAEWQQELPFAVLLACHGFDSHPLDPQNF